MSPVKTEDIIDDGYLGILERKHVEISDIIHIGKESDVLNEPFELDEYSYEFYDCRN